MPTRSSQREHPSLTHWAFIPFSPVLCSSSFLMVHNSPSFRRETWQNRKLVIAKLRSFAQTIVMAKLGW